MRTSHKEAHGYSAFFLVYGTHPRWSSEDILQENTTLEELENNGFLLWSRFQEIIEMNNNIIPKAKENIQKYQEKMILNYNKSTKKSIFRIGDLVWVLDRKLSDLATSLIPKWLGSFRLAEKVGQDVYLMKDRDTKLPYAFHANQMKIYKSRPRLQADLKFYSRVNNPRL